MSTAIASATLVRTDAGPEEIRVVHARYARHQDPADLERLVAEYQDLASRLAHRFYRHREPLEDLRQVAYEALLRALQRFDPDLGHPFEAFATASIAGVLKRHYRDRGWSIRVPRVVHDTLPRLQRVSDALRQRDGRAPTMTELASALDLSLETVIEVLDAGAARDVGMLDVATLDTGADRGGLSSIDTRFTQVDDRESLRLVLSRLSVDEQELIRLRYFENLSQIEIGRRVGCSQVQVSRLLRRALSRLRALLAADQNGGWSVRDAPMATQCEPAC